MAYPFASLKAKSVNHVSGTLCKLSVRAGHLIIIGDKGIRTPGLTGAIRALYQLSYIPIKVNSYPLASVKIIART